MGALYSGLIALWPADGRGPVVGQRQEALQAVFVFPDVGRSTSGSPMRSSNGAAAPVGARAERSVIVAPPPVVIPLPAPVISASVPDEGSASVGGTADAETGTGAGGVGSGDGAGGTGGDGGGLATRSRRLSGTIRPADYPAPERRARVEGSVTVRFIVGTNGQVRHCAVARSSGNAALDATTCRLIERRFRYIPAIDRLGRAVTEERGWRQDWWLGDGERPGR